MSTEMTGNFKRWTAFDNHKRPHQALGLKTRAETFKLVATPGHRTDHRTPESGSPHEPVPSEGRRR